MDAEAIEKARQEIMRLRELLDISHSKLAEGEAFYVRLFDSLTDEAKALPEKERQREAAKHVLNDASLLKQAVLHMQFNARELQREFETLYGIILEN